MSTGTVCHERKQDTQDSPKTGNRAELHGNIPPNLAGSDARRPAMEPPVQSRGQSHESTRRGSNVCGESSSADPSAIDAKSAAGDDPLVLLAARCVTAPALLPSLIERSKTLSRLAYDQKRLALAKAAGVRVATLDLEVLGNKAEAEATPSGLINVEPCETTVDGAELLAQLADFLSRFVDAPAHYHDTVALHLMFGHALDAFTIAPRLFVTSPEKRCGKSLLLEVIASLSQRPLLAAQVTDALLPRIIERFAPTVILDEIDTYNLREREGLAGILNSGHRRSGAYSWKIVGENFDPKSFSTWATYIFGGIAGKMPETTLDRCIVLQMGRKPQGRNVERFGRRHESEARALAAKAARWAMDSMSLLREIDERDDDDEGLAGISGDRARDNWRPLLAIAELAGGGWVRRARTAASQLSGSEPEPESAGPMLLRDLAAIFAEAGPGTKALRSSQIVERLLSADFAERPWRDWRRSKPIDERGLAKLLKQYGVSSRNVPTLGEQGKGYEFADLQDAVERYAVTRATPPSDRPNVPTASIVGDERDGRATETRPMNHGVPLNSNVYGRWDPVTAENRVTNAGLSADGTQVGVGDEDAW
ncbi:MAG TPA: DUF3631 domain-containing protein [Candidatus Limnocylindrales bacterium]|nr:DUF3631 domain-containing protein [Candidatus Limnocylindrales bacterium]